MLNYLEKFNNIDQVVRDKVSTPQVMGAISELENKYGVSLAAVIMRIMVKDVSILDLPKFFVFEFGIDGKAANTLAEELKEKVFFGVAEYLGIAKDTIPDINDPAKNWKDTKSNETAIRSSAFFFSTEDEEEVKQLANTLAPAAPAPDKTPEYEERIGETISKLNLNFSSEELLKRYKNILTTYLKGVRNKVDAKQALGKSIDSGGLSMEVPRIDSIFLILDKIRASEAEKTEQPKPPVKIELPEDKQSPMIRADQIDEIFKSNLGTSGARDIDYDFSKIAERSQEIKENNVIPENKSTEKESHPAPEPNIIVGDKTNANEKNIQEIKPADNTVSLKGRPDNQNDIATFVRRPKTSLGKVRMDDVKHIAKLTGPLDELSDMDTTSFRRLNENVKDRIEVIKEKIHFLEEESYAQRLAGIKAWRQSPVYKLYLDIGQESMKLGKPVEFVIEKRRSLGEEYLTPVEFEAIMELNRTLRY